MKYAYILVIAILISIMSLPNVFAGGIESVENLFFSLKIPDDWTYTEYSNTGMSQLLGRGPVNDIELTPSEFSDILLDSEFTKVIEKIQDEGSPYASFGQDVNYPIKNAPLESYVKYNIDELGVQNITSQEYTTVGKEKAIRIDVNDSALFGNIPVTLYFIMHDKQPYRILYLGNTENYQKYLPDFDQILKSFRFVDNVGENKNLSEFENMTNTITNFSGANLTDYNSTNKGNYPEELYDECVRVAGESFCEFLFRR